jgi:hypothetical protein
MRGHPKFLSIFVSFGALMKLKQIALASLVVVAGSSFATTVTCDPSTRLSMANTCAPEVTFFIAGASALGDATNAVLSANSFGGYFASSPTVIVDRGTPNGVAVNNPTNNGAPGNGVTAWYGMSKAELTGGTSKRMLIVYNKYMGSAAGVSNVMSKDMKSVMMVPEAQVVTVGPVLIVPGKPTKGVQPNSCVTTTTNTSTIACTSWAWTKADVGLSDVDVPELVRMYDNKKVKLSDMTRVPVAMQGFAVGVNNKFYTDLQAYQVSTGALPGSCTPVAPATFVYTEACQPSISSAQYASLVTKEGGIKSAAGFIPGSTEALVLARRDDLSGTQAASQIFFGKSVCNAKDPKSKVNLGGAMVATNEVDFPNKAVTTGSLIVNHNVQSSAVATDLTRTDAYAIGVLTLASGAASTYKFVKLDGVSPNFAKGGTTTLASAALRNNMINGAWPFQVVSYVMYPNTSVGTDPVLASKKGLIEKFQADLSDSSLHNLTAISYFNGTADKQSLVHRATAKASGTTAAAYNNCAPLTFR